MTPAKLSTAALGRALRAAAAPDQPAALFDCVRSVCDETFGFRLMTILRHLPASGEIARLYSSHPGAYPPGGRKPMGPTPWGRIVLEQGHSWLGNGAEDIRWAFPDADRILSLGCDACACAPVVRAGRTLGVISLSDRRDSYAAADLDALAVLAQTLLPAF